MEYPLFEVGDIVRIDDYEALKARANGERDGALIGFAAGFMAGMRKYCGTIQEVSLLGRVKDRYYLKDAGGWSWSPDMFDLSFHQESEFDFEITEEDLLKIL